MTQMCCFSGICLIWLETLNKNENEIHLHSFCLMNTCWLVVASTLWKLTLELSQPWRQAHFCVIYGMPSSSVLKFRTSNVCPQHLSRYTESLRWIHREGTWGLAPKFLYFPTFSTHLGFISLSAIFFPSLFKMKTVLLDQKDGSKIRDETLAFVIHQYHLVCWLIFVNTEVSWDNNYSKTFLITGFWSRDCPVVWEGESTLT